MGDTSFCGLLLPVDAPFYRNFIRVFAASDVGKHFSGDLKQRIIRIANDLIDHCINSEMEDSERKDEILQKKNQISRVKNKLNNLLDMRLADEISKDIYNKKKDELENELAFYEKQIEELTNFSPLSQEEIDNRIELLKYAASHQLDFDKYNIPDEIIDAFVEKIVVYKDYFEWYLKFDDDDCIRCLVNGTKRKNEVQIVRDTPSGLLQHRQHWLRNRNISHMEAVK